MTVPITEETEKRAHILCFSPLPLLGLPTRPDMTLLDPLLEARLADDLALAIFHIYQTKGRSRGWNIKETATSMLEVRISREGFMRTRYQSRFELKETR